MTRVSIRHARPSDYQGYYDMEKIAWENTGIKPLDEHTFLSWLAVFPEGCLVALDGQEKLVGLVASQICAFDPHNPDDCQKSFDELTDYGHLVDTHNPHGNTLYIVTNSAIYPGAGYKLMSALCDLTMELEKKYCAGACRLPDLHKAMLNKDPNQSDREFAAAYVQEIGGCRYRKERRFGPDPVLSVLARYPDAQIYDVVNCFLSEEDAQSCNWSCVMGWENPHSN